MGTPNNNQPYLPRRGKRSGTTQYDQNGNRLPGEVNHATGEPLGASDPMSKPHSYAAFDTAFQNSDGASPAAPARAASSAPTPSMTPGVPGVAPKTIDPGMAGEAPKDIDPGMTSHEPAATAPAPRAPNGSQIGPVTYTPTGPVAMMQSQSGPRSVATTGDTTENLVHRFGPEFAAKPGEALEATSARRHDILMAHVRGTAPGAAPDTVGNAVAANPGANQEFQTPWGAVSRTGTPARVGVQNDQPAAPPPGDAMEREQFVQNRATIDAAKTQPPPEMARSGEANNQPAMPEPTASPSAAPSTTPAAPATAANSNGGDVLPLPQAVKDSLNPTASVVAQGAANLAGNTVKGAQVIGDAALRGMGRAVNAESNPLSTVADAGLNAAGAVGRAGAKALLNPQGVDNARSLWNRVSGGMRAGAAAGDVMLRAPGAPLGVPLQSIVRPAAPVTLPKPAPAPAPAGSAPTAGMGGLPNKIAPWLDRQMRMLRVPKLRPSGPQTGPASLPNRVASSYA